MIARKLTTFGTILCTCIGMSVSLADSPNGKIEVQEVHDSNVSAMTRLDAKQMKASAKILKINKEGRIITCELEPGKKMDFKVAPGVKRFDEIKVGDSIWVEHSCTMNFEVREPTPAEKASPGILSVDITKTLLNADTPPTGGTIIMAHTATTISKIVPETRMVTLKGPKGNTLEVQVRKPEAMKKLKLGDSVMVTYLEALALGLDPAEK